MPSDDSFDRHRADLEWHITTNQPPEPPYFTPANIVITLLGFALAFWLAALVVSP
jgi:hypothetical protein